MCLRNINFIFLLATTVKHYCIHFLDKFSAIGTENTDGLVSEKKLK